MAFSLSSLLRLVSSVLILFILHGLFVGFRSVEFAGQTNRDTFNVKQVFVYLYPYFCGPVASPAGKLNKVCYQRKA